MTVRVRYNGRKDTQKWVQKMDGGYWETVRGRPKNTLVTVRVRDRIFFGVARYDSAWGLPFVKKFGRKVAEGRANSFRKAMGGTPLPESLEGIVYAESGMAGCCNLESIKLLLNYFDNIDEFAPQGKTPYNMSEQMQVLAGVEKAENFPDLMPPMPEPKEQTITVNPERLQHLAGV